jgi:hypothetical protein
MYVACLGVDTNDQISNRLIIYIRSRFAIVGLYKMRGGIVLMY